MCFDPVERIKFRNYVKHASFCWQTNRQKGMAEKLLVHHYVKFISINLFKLIN